MQLPNEDLIISEILSECNIFEVPVPIDDVAKSFFGLSIDEENIEGEGYLIDLGNIGGQIIINKNTKYERKRFTIAHELGHWVLQTHGISLEKQKEAKLSKLIERWCNRFAAGLLMPESLIVDQIRQVNTEHLLPVILTMPRSFLVSKEALIIRITETCPISMITMSQTKSNDLKVGKVYLSCNHIDKQVYKVISKRNELVSKNESRRVVEISDDFRFLSLMTTKNRNGYYWLTAMVTTSFW